MKLHFFKEKSLRRAKILLVKILRPYIIELFILGIIPERVVRYRIVDLLLEWEEG